MDRWHQERRLAGARDAQANINEKMATEAREATKGMSWFGPALFIVGLIYVQTIAEYCIQTYNDLVAIVRSVAVMVGF